MSVCQRGRIAYARSAAHSCFAAFGCRPSATPLHCNDIRCVLRAVQNTVGIPVAPMDDSYSKETLALAEVVDKYAGMDLYDAERPKLVGVWPHPENSPDCITLIASNIGSGGFVSL